MTTVGPGEVAFIAAWSFFAYGPQLALCLWFGYATARRRGGSLLDWLAIAFLWSLLPFVGVGAMWWSWHRSGRRPAPGAEDPETTT